MSTISDYHNPGFYNPEFGDFTKFYIIIAIITTIGTLLFLLNIAVGCCSHHSQYWGDRHTGMLNMIYNFFLNILTEKCFDLLFNCNATKNKSYVYYNFSFVSCGKCLHPIILFSKAILFVWFQFFCHLMMKSIFVINNYKYPHILI